MHIYHLYSKYNDNEIVIYSPENEKFILVDIDSKKNVIIKMPTNSVFSPNYFWNNNVLIMITFNDEFYRLCFTSYTLRHISSEDVKKICPSFFNFWSYAKNYSVIKFYPELQAFIAKTDTETISFFSYAQQEHIQAKNFDSDWHDVECNNNVFMFIYEQKIEILNHEDKVILRPRAKYIFVRAKFLNSNQIIVLSSNPSNFRECVLEIYTFRNLGFI